MAKQKGIIPLQGAIGDVNFFKSKDGFMAGRKGGVSGDRIATEAKFQRTRENNAEFGRAATYGKLIRNAFQSLLLNAKDSRSTARLGGEMRKVIKADLVNERGMRNIIDGEAELLQDFDFNVNGQLASNFKAQFTATISRVTGVLEVSIPSFIPKNQLIAPGGTTHYVIHCGGSAINFEQNEFETQINSSAQLPFDNAATAAMVLTNQVTANSPYPLFLVLGIEYFQQVNGVMYPLKGGSFNSLKLVKILGY